MRLREAAALRRRAGLLALRSRRRVRSSVSRCSVNRSAERNACGSASDNCGSAPCDSDARRLVVLGPTTGCDCGSRMTPCDLTLARRAERIRVRALAWLCALTLPLLGACELLAPLGPEP